MQEQGVALAAPSFTRSMYKKYRKRNELLRRLGFESYDHYRKSETWINIRERQLVNNSRCFGCNNVATQVHHTEYTEANLTGRSRQGLVSVCSSCHRRAEFKNGEKVSLKVANKRLRRRRKVIYFTRWEERQMNEELRARIEREP